MKKWNWKSIILTIFLLLLLIVVIYSLIGITITGPYYAGQSEGNKVIEKIEKNEKEDIISISRHSFEYVTYTCETKKKYVIYNEKGERILSRKKTEMQLEEVNKIVNKTYPALAKQEIQLSYGYENAVYLIEDDNYTKLMLDFDTLEEVFYMKEGE